MKAVLFVAENLYGPRFWVPFFKKLKAETGAKVYCLAPSFAHVNDYQKHRDIIDGILQIDDILAGYGDFEPEFDEEAANLARSFEEHYSAHLFDIIQGDRHLGRGTYYLGHHHPRSRHSKIATLGRSIRYIDALAQRLDEFCSEHDIGTYITGGVGADFTKIMCMIARRRDINIRILFSSRSGQLFTWYEDEFFGHSRLLSRFRELRQSAKPIDVEARHKTVNQGDLDVWNKSLRHTRYSHALKRALGLIVNEVRFFLVRQIKYRDKPRFNRYLLGDNIRHLFRIPHQWNDLIARITPDGDLMANAYVFYALQVEPETSTTVLAPEFNNQIAIIDLLSKSLPADTLLVIKEHMPAVGRRPKDFYAWLSDIPNVRLAHPMSDAPGLARKAAVVATLSGTIGIEAAGEGVPVLSFGRHNLYNEISHVHLVEEHLSLRRLLRQLLDERANETARDVEKRVWEGQQFLQALEDVSCDIGDDVMFHGDPNAEALPPTVDGLCELLIKADKPLPPRPVKRGAKRVAIENSA